MVRDIVIAGAGIGGLTLAAALGRRGATVTVLERATALTTAGAGLALPSNGMQGLARLGLAEGARLAGAPLGLAMIRDPSGRVLGSQIDLTPVFREFGAPAVALRRARLHQVLLEAVGAGVVRTGISVHRYERCGNRVKVDCGGGEGVEADVLVGADGLHSTVRAQMIGDGEPVYAGYTSWRGVTPGGAVPALTRMSETWGRGERFGMVDIGFGEIYWFAVADAPPGGRDGDVRAELLGRFGRWHEPIPALIDATPPSRILRTDIADRTPIGRWHDGPVVLLGDAAHPMTPNLGQGAGQAIEDAVVLDQCLARSGSLEAALVAYESRRVARANRILLGSRRFGVVSQWKHPIAAWLRDTAFHLLPSRLQLDQARRLMSVDF